VVRGAALQQLADRQAFHPRFMPAADERGDFSEAEREQKFAGHSLRAGLATSVAIEERHVRNSLVMPTLK